MTYIQPLLPILLLIAVCASAFSWGVTRAKSHRILVLAVAALLLCSWPPAAWLATRPFEMRYSPHPRLPEDAQALVVLSSAVYPESPPLPAARLGSDTFERCQYAAWLYSHWRNLPVLASGGGRSAEDDETPPYAMVMREALEKEGVPAPAIWTEERSRSTYENALFSAEILRKKGISRIVLVTDAYHMVRAEKCFRKQGIEVFPAACGFRTMRGFHPVWLLPSWEAIAWNEDVLHETVGLLWYKIRNRV